ncbi:hypothetical protein IQ06DRAFT_310017 [Phaeosphaeriaceae sp. SRC1lsM3a]|nr:hypothetical protein IQ06DRAFT_310017 [Stagonospora sp. SRC1lsM3a]
MACTRGTTKDAMIQTEKHMAERSGSQDPRVATPFPGRVPVPRRKLARETSTLRVKDVKTATGYPACGRCGAERSMLCDMESSRDHTSRAVKTIKSMAPRARGEEWRGADATETSVSALSRKYAAVRFTCMVVHFAQAEGCPQPMPCAERSTLLRRRTIICK